MQYMILLYADPAIFDGMSEAERGRVIESHGTLTAELESDGRLLASNALQPPETASTVREREGRVEVTDGPFAETREALGGYYLIDVKDLDAALAVAERMPGTAWGSTEVRPVWETPSAKGGAS